MSAIAPAQRVAILIDGDNTSLQFAKHILELATYYGKRKICNAYGDWQQLPLSIWLTPMRELNITPVQQDRIGKNATDNRILIEAGEMLQANKADIFFIASSDGDFAALGNYLRTKGKSVIGVGKQKISSLQLRESCNAFYYLETLALLTEQEIKTKILLDTVLSQLPSSDGWIHLGNLCHKLQEQYPDYKDRLGTKTLSQVLTKLAAYYEYKDQMIRKIQ